MSIPSRAFPLDPMRPVISLDDSRLQRLFLQDPTRCASLSEYAQATGIDVAALAGMLATHLDSGTLSLEAVGGEVFIHTAPAGRPTPAQLPQVPPNLWELLRRAGDTDHAFRLWRLTRELEQGGWLVEADPKRIPMTSTGEIALVGLRLGAYVSPVVVLPAHEDLSHPAGVLSRFERQSVPLVSVICRRGELDLFTTAVRQWMFSRPLRTPLRVAILEAPRYQPVLLSGSDHAVTPTSVTREALGALVDPDAGEGIDAADAPR